MNTRIDEIADGIYRISTFIPQVAPPAGFQFNQFLLKAEQPLLFHCGQRFLFEGVRDAVSRVVPVEQLRWISFSHYEADECGSMNLWQEAAPRAQVAHGELGCNVSLNDASLRAPRPLADGAVLDLGGKRVRYLATPHVPHGWDAGLMYEETTGTLLCSDLLAHLGDRPAVAPDDVVGPALDSERMFRAMCVNAGTIATLRKLAQLQPRTLALMHGSSVSGDGGAVLSRFADGLAEQPKPAA